jgi:hypothetical protein
VKSNTKSEIRLQIHHSAHIKITFVFEILNQVSFQRFYLKIVSQPKKAVSRFDDMSALQMGVSPVFHTCPQFILYYFFFIAPPYLTAVL